MAKQTGRVQPWRCRGIGSVLEGIQAVKLRQESEKFQRVEELKGLAQTRAFIAPSERAVETKNGRILPGSPEVLRWLRNLVKSARDSGVKATRLQDDSEKAEQNLAAGSSESLTASVTRLSWLSHRWPNGATSCALGCPHTATPQPSVP